MNATEKRATKKELLLALLQDGATECVLYEPAGRDGYARTRASGRTFLAHRWMYEQMVGPIPTGLQLDHLCRVRNCVNPRHLEPVTQRINILRGTAPTAINATKTHCPKGHVLAGYNLAPSRKGRGQCRTCQNVYGARYAALHREQKRAYDTERRRRLREAK